MKYGIALLKFISLMKNSIQPNQQPFKLSATNQSNIVYTINYLNIAKKTKSEIRFLSELLSASKQFPNSPEITLSLARAYDRNSRYRFKAKEYYTKFITLAPNHPQRSEAEAAILRLP